MLLQRGEALYLCLDEKFISSI